MNDKYYVFSWTVVGIVSLVIILISLFGETRADWSLAILIASDHRDSGYTCNGSGQNYNERNPGLFVKYKQFVIGRFENSYSGCNGHKYSSLVGLEPGLGMAGPFSMSTSLALANGYPEENQLGEYRIWASINARFGIAKIYYGYDATALGLQWNF